MLFNSGLYTQNCVSFLILALEFLFTHNYFYFVGSYLQRRGAAMGAVYSPTSLEMLIHVATVLFGTLAT